MESYLTGNNYRFPIFGFDSAACGVITANSQSCSPGHGYWVYSDMARLA